MWHDWFRKRVADNVPYDQIVRDILTATSRDGQTPEEWIEFVKKIDEQTEKGFEHRLRGEEDARPVLAAAAAGADRAVGREGRGRVPRRAARMRPVPQAPDRPLDAGRLLGLRQHLRAGHVRRTTSSARPDVKKLRRRRERRAPRRRRRGRTTNQIMLVREMFVGANARQPCAAEPGDEPRAARPRRSAGRRSRRPAGEDARVEARRRGCAAPDNPFFARSFVNRVWAHYFGVGLVDPVDDFSLANPPTNARLLDALAAGLRRERVRHPQAGADDPAEPDVPARSRSRTRRNKFDKNNFAHAYVRPLMAEQVVDVLNAALGVDEPFSGQDAAAGGHEDGRGRGEPAAQPEPGVRPAHLRPAAADDGLRLRAGDGAGPAADALPHDRPDDARASSPTANGRVAKLAQDEADERRAGRGAVPGDAGAAADGRREGRRARAPDRTRRPRRRASPTCCGR